MAKRRAKSRPDKAYRHLKIKSEVIVNRTSRGGADAFIACVKIGRGSGVATRPNIGCSPGRNPRAAIARALRHMATQLRTRHGAFAGLK